MADGTALSPALQGFLGNWNPEAVASKTLAEAAERGLLPARVLCLGKAAWGLARAADAVWPGIAGLAYGTARDGRLPKSFSGVVGEHPFPTEANEERTARVERWIAEGEGPLLACVSGGGSALLVHPRAPWTLEMKAGVTRELWRRGAAIRDLNAVRARLSEVKGGGLLRFAKHWPVTTALWSDVGPRDGRFVSSGPTLPLSLRGEAEEVMARYGMHLPAPLPPERAPARSARSGRVLLLCDAIRLRKGCAAWLAAMGFSPREISVGEGEATEAVAARLAFLASSAKRSPLALVGVGEARVDASREAGRGGRCSHLCAEVALAICESKMASSWAFAALATDGVDGSAGAGAWVDRGSRPARRDLRAAIAAFDTGALFERTGQLLPKHPTGNNLRDLWVMVVEP